MSGSLRRFIRSILLEDLAPTSNGMVVLKNVEAGDYHMLPSDYMSDADRDQADRLVRRGLLRWLPANERFPARYVVTSGGSHALGTFKGASMHGPGSKFEGIDHAGGLDLAAVRHELMTTWDRKKLIDWLCWNDANGIWTDKDMLANDMDPMSQEEAVDQIMAFVEETGETPEGMMQGSLDSVPGRYPDHSQFDRFLKR